MNPSSKQPQILPAHCCVCCLHRQHCSTHTTQHNRVLSRCKSPICSRLCCAKLQAEPVDGSDPRDEYTQTTRNTHMHGPMSAQHQLEDAHPCRTSPAGQCQHKPFMLQGAGHRPPACCAPHVVHAHTPFDLRLYQGNIFATQVLLAVLRRSGYTGTATTAQHSNST